MNNISKTQNEPKQLQRLAAQRHLYSTAKQVFGAQVILGAPIAIIGALTVLAFPSAKGYAAFWGLLVSLGDLLWLNPWQKQLRESAAKIQESFDCDVLQLPWNDFKVGRHPDPEQVKEQADKFSKASLNLPPLANWYAPAVGELPLEVARIICQRSNCWWDSKQRRRYAIWVITGVVFAIISVFGLGLIGELSVEKLFFAIIAPLSPAIILGTRQFSEQMEAANRLDRLKEYAEWLWSDACCQTPVAELTARSRALQDEIFENRKRSPLVFDWIFRRLRNDYEAQMNHGVEELALEAKQRLGLH